MTTRKLLGRMVCPICATPEGMRITEDKNGEPFAFCDATCGAQIRIGGSPLRVREFYRAHPGMKPEPEPAKPAPKPAAKPEPEPEQKAAPKPPPAAPARSLLEQVLNRGAA